MIESLEELEHFKNEVTKEVANIVGVELGVGLPPLDVSDKTCCELPDDQQVSSGSEFEVDVIGRLQEEWDRQWDDVNAESFEGETLASSSDDDDPGVVAAATATIPVNNQFQALDPHASKRKSDQKPARVHFAQPVSTPPSEECKATAYPSGEEALAPTPSPAEGVPSLHNGDAEQSATNTKDGSAGGTAQACSSEAADAEEGHDGPREIVFAMAFESTRRSVRINLIDLDNHYVVATIKGHSKQKKLRDIHRLVTEHFGSDYPIQIGMPDPSDGSKIVDAPDQWAVDGEMSKYLILKITTRG